MVPYDPITKLQKRFQLCSFTVSQYHCDGPNSRHMDLGRQITFNHSNGLISPPVFLMPLSFLPYSKLIPVWSFQKEHMLSYLCFKYWLTYFLLGYKLFSLPPVPSLQLTDFPHIVTAVRSFIRSGSSISLLFKCAPALLVQTM